MNIIKYNKFQFSPTSSNFFLIPQNINIAINFDNILPFLNSEYKDLFNQNTQALNIKNFPPKDLIDITTKTALLHSVNETTCMLDTNNNKVYVIADYEYNEYLYSQEPWPYDKEVPTEIELAEKNLISSTKIPLDNFIKLINDWHQLNLQKVPFALLYQDEQDWIACKGFETQEAMEAFVKQHSNEQS